MSYVLAKKRSNGLKTATGAKCCSLILLVALSILTPLHVWGQTPPVGSLWVTYVDATPTATETGENLVIVFRVVYYCCDEYLGTISSPAVGIKTASFLIVSVLTQGSKEYPNVPVFPTTNKGEYRAEIQIAQDNPTGRVWVYVEGNSLKSSECFCTANTQIDSVGPPGNTASEQTYDVSDISLIQIGQPPSPSPFENLLQGNEVLLLLLAAIILLLLAATLLARRKRKPPEGK